MKQLHDGTFVADSTPTRNVNGLRYLLTPEEIVERNQQGAAEIERRNRKAKADRRLAALAGRWADPFALLDDILERGVEAVKAERDAIKAANPKPDAPTKETP